MRTGLLSDLSVIGYDIFLEGETSIYDTKNRIPPRNLQGSLLTS